MNDVSYLVAGQNDYEDIIDFIDLIFSQSSRIHYFIKELPKLYKREFFMDGIHYLAKEGDRIKAVVGSFPLKYEFSSGISLAGRGIGMVSVHSLSRSRGYMKTLMNMAHKDMEKDGSSFACLSGQRQRYEYFGYTPAGSIHYFTISEYNIRHTLGRDWKTSLELKPVNTGDKDLLDHIHALHEAKNEKMYRSRDRFYEILNSWESKTFAFISDKGFEGYIVIRPGSIDAIEFNLLNTSYMQEAIGLFLQKQKECGAQDSLIVAAGSHEIEKIALFSQFAEKCSQTTPYHFHIVDYRKFIEPFLKLKAKQQNIMDGSFVLKIEGKGGGNFLLSSKGGSAEISESSLAPDLVLDPMEATRFLFNPPYAVTDPKIRETIFLQSLLPLPLFFENLDGV